jgi:aminopeptidase N
MTSSETHFVQRVRRGAAQGGIGDLDRPIIDTAATDLMGLLNENNYGKAAWMLHELRGLVGDSAFVRGLRDYYADHRDGTALSDDLQRSMEQASGQSLGWFFREAFTLPGLPVLQVRWARVAGRRWWRSRRCSPMRGACAASRSSSSRSTAR